MVESAYPFSDNAAMPGYNPEYMEKFPGSPRSPESGLVQKYGLTAGRKAAFEKVAMRSPSSVPVGEVQEGTLQSDVRVGIGIGFSDSSARISEVKRIEEKWGELFIYTETSTYVFRPEAEQGKAEDFAWDDVDVVETAKGSTYRYLPDGTTQRFKKVEGKEYDPQAALVYVPSFEWIEKHATPEMLQKLGDEDYIYNDNLLEYVQNPFKDGRAVYIVDTNGRKIETNQEIKNTKGPIYLAFLKDDKTQFFIPISHKPVLGFSTFDTRLYTDEKTGQRMRERHLGNPVVRITLKDKN
jgi:hypothetical protein